MYRKFLQTKALVKAPFSLLFLLLIFSFNATVAQINFGQSNLNMNGHGSLNGVTSLTFGPDGRLYVAEYPGTVKVLTIQRAGANNFIVTAIEALAGVKNIVNHDDNGTVNTSEVNRETIGLAVIGTAASPVIYVSSSDFRIGAGTGGGNGDVNLDTNSGIITRFSRNGAVWEVTDLVRGLPRSEENHATNGLEFVNIKGTNYLLVAQGGHTNGGAPSTNFVYSCEYALSAAILSINLDMLNTMPIKTDANGRKYIYDLPTLDDPGRANLNGVTDPDNAAYNGIDIYDPFGGNDGLNQAILVGGGPVQIFSPGYRNAYDLVVTENGAVYVSDNGANAGWGGFPVNEGTANVTNAYVPSEPGSQSPTADGEFINNKDHLQLVTLKIDNYTFGSFYGGHPNPSRANPAGAGLYTDNGTGFFRNKIYDPNGSRPNSSTNPNQALPANWTSLVPAANLVEGDWRGPGINNPEGPADDPVTVWGTNTNGLDEYTASNFGGALKGNLIAGVNTGVLRRVELNSNGTLNKLTTNFASGLGGNALGVTCNSDSDPFPGTIWAGTLNGLIVVLEPADLAVCLSPGQAGYNANADYDQDGYTNKDETDNGTDLCNGGSQPDDFDKSAGAPFFSNLNDTDDDNDGISDQNDPFQLGNTSTSGSDAFTIPVQNGLFNDQQGLGGIFGLGLTGLMNNGAVNPNWLNWTDKRGQGPNPDDVLGGAPGLMTSHMTSGTANGTPNTQEKGYQYGVQVNQNTGIFTVAGKMINFSGPLRLYGNNAAVGGELGYFIGDGTQSNFLKFVINTSGLKIQQEINNIPQTPINISIPVNSRPQGGIEFFFVINPSSGNVTLEYIIDGGTRNVAGSLTAQGSILAALQQAGKDLAVGFTGTSNTEGVELEGTWDYLNVTLNGASDILRINAGGTLVAAGDAGSDWQPNNSNGAFTGNGFTVNTGRTYTGNLLYAGRHSSIPSYIDQNTFNAIFAQERNDGPAGAEMKYSVPLANGNYIINLYMGDGFSGTNQPGDRIFDIVIEDQVVYNDLDLMVQFGPMAGGLLSFPAAVADGQLTIEFLHEVENPLVNAIEILSAGNSQLPIAVADIANQTSVPGAALNGSLGVNASGGEGNLNYALSGHPPGVFIEPTNGQIGGTISQSALQGSPYTVTVTVDDSDGITTDAISKTFTWSILNSWTSKSENESYTARHENSFVQAGNKFYLMGGRENARTIDIYDYTSNTWTSLPNAAPKEFNHFQATEYQGLIWVIGSFSTNNYPNELPEENIWAFDPAKKVWIKGPLIPVARRRGAAGLVVYNDKFYLVAGNTNGHSGGYVSWLDEYDPATGKWTTLTNAPRARDHFAAVVIGTKLYAAGGRLSGGTGGVFAPTIPQVDVYNFATASWSTLPVGQNIPTQRAGASAVNFNDKLIVIGGEIGSQTSALKTTEEYDPLTQSWRALGDLVFARHGTQAIVSGNGIFILGGSPLRGGGNQKNMEFFGEDAPVGSASSSSTLAGPTAVQVVKGTPKTVNLSVSSGSVGIMITSMTLTGPNASEFSFASGKLTNQLLVPGSKPALTLNYSGNVSGHTANLVIAYGASDQLVIPLTGTVSGAVGGVISLTLINANTDIDLFEISEGQQISAGSIQNTPLNIRANTNPQLVGSVQLVMTGPVNKTIRENTAPYALFGDTNGNYTGQPFPAGSYTIKGTAYSGANLGGTNLGSLTRNFTVVSQGGNQPPVAVASASPGSGNLPFTVNFTGGNSTDDTGVVSYLWDFKDGSTSTAINPAHTFNTAGIFTVSLKVTDAGGLSDTTTVAVTANTPATNGVTSFSMMNSASDTELFLITSGMQINAVTLQNIPLNIRVNTNPATVGSVGMVLTGPFGRTITENTAPYALLGDTAGDYNGQLFPQGTYTLTGTAYSLPNKKGSIINTRAVQFTIGSQGTAKGLPHGIIAEDPAVTDIGDNTLLQGMSLYPNPAGMEFHISWQDGVSDLKDVNLFDESGRFVRSFDAKRGLTAPGHYSFDLREVPSGVYILMISTDAGTRQSLRLLVRK